MWRGGHPEVIGTTPKQPSFFDFRRTDRSSMQPGFSNGVETHVLASDVEANHVSESAIPGNP